MFVAVCGRKKGREEERERAQRLLVCGRKKKREREIVREEGSGRGRGRDGEREQEKRKNGGGGEGDERGGWRQSVKERGEEGEFMGEGVEGG